MSDLPPAKRRRVAPVVVDPMAPAAPAAPPAPPAEPAVERAPDVEAAPASRAAAAPYAPTPSRRQEPTVQLGTRVRPESDRRLRDLAAARGTTIRQVIEDLVDDAWNREIAGKSQTSR